MQQNTTCIMKEEILAQLRPFLNATALADDLELDDSSLRWFLLSVETMARRIYDLHSQRDIQAVLGVGMTPIEELILDRLRSAKAERWCGTQKQRHEWWKIWRIEVYFLERLIEEHTLLL